MASELAATRLVASHFGTSTPVFATRIAFALSGLALGAALGGRAADRWAADRRAALDALQKALVLADSERGPALGAAVPCATRVGLATSASVTAPA